MTPTDQWIMCLALVYAVPSFLCGVGTTLLFLRWQARTAMAPGFALPWQAYEGIAPADERHPLLPEGFGLL